MQSMDMYAWVWSGVPTCTASNLSPIAFSILR